MIKKYIIIIFTFIISLVSYNVSYAETQAEDQIQLIVDGKNLTELSSPVIENNRMLIPLKFVSDAIGAEVIWDEEKRSVRVTRDNKEILLFIGNRLIEFNKGDIYKLSDVKPTIIHDRTYVPLRLMSNGLGIGIKWDPSLKTVFVDSNQTSDLETFYPIKIQSHTSGATISGQSYIELSMGDYDENQVKETRLILLDANTGKGFVVTRRAGLSPRVLYVPKVEDKGKKVLVAAVYGEKGEFLGGDSLGVNIDVKPEVFLEGQITDKASGKVQLSQKINFLAAYVNYELTNLDTGKVSVIKESDPKGIYSWTPEYKENGSYRIKVVAFDGQGRGYGSPSIVIVIDVERRLALRGVKEGSTLNKPVTLIASRNFDVSETEYLIMDEVTGVETTLEKMPYGGYRWFPDLTYNGNKKLKVRVKDVNGSTYDSEWIRVTIDGSPKVYLQGIGPKQVLSDGAKLSVVSNVALDHVNYLLKNTKTGLVKSIGQGLKAGDTLIYNPVSADSGDVSIYVEAQYKDKKLYSEPIPFKVYLDTLYGPRAIIDKSDFLNFASQLAKESLNETGMSAALQTAQAILETGWGQKLPVDKYSGKLSYNLFGIKGTGTNGYVVSNTWEVYNGVTYRVDAQFRAYNTIKEGWQGHKAILLNLARYEQFRQVMYDSTLGAWAVKRAGYATDPKYPMKLMNIINNYELHKLDEVGIE